MAIIASSARASGNDLTVSVLKVRGTVTRPADDGGVTPLVNGAEVPLNARVTVAKLSIAVYKAGDGFILKQEPRTTLSFTRLVRQPTPKGHASGLDINLQKGDFFAAVKESETDPVDCHVMTSRIEAITHGAVFEVTHANSTSVVSVREGIVVVLYCRNTKKAIVHAGEVFSVTDCEGVLRWFTQDEIGRMDLFAATIDSAFLAAVLPIFAFLPPAVLGPTIPPDLPMISP